MFEFKEIKSEAEYKSLELKPDVPFTQAWFFGEWQKAMGRKVRRFEILNNSKNYGFFQVIKYPVPFGQNFLYIPHGPVLTHNNGFSKEFYEKLAEIEKEERVIFVRFDPYFHNSNYGSMRDLDKYFKKVPNYAYHSSYFQPKREWILDLNKTEEDLFGEMHPKTRYNIRLAEKKGVSVEIIKQNFKKYFNDFYCLLKETARRDNFNLHPENYYENIFINCEKDKNAFLTLAKYDNKILAINLILLFGDTAYFIFGGSSDEHKNLMFSYSAQWEAMKETKKQGFKIYNFGAVGAGQYEGISRFKQSFGGHVLEYSDSYDLVLKPFWYFLYNLRKWLLNQK